MLDVKKIYNPLFLESIREPEIAEKHVREKHDYEYDNEGRLFEIKKSKPITKDQNIQYTATGKNKYKYNDKSKNWSEFDFYDKENKLIYAKVRVYNKDNQEKINSYIEYFKYPNKKEKTEFCLISEDGYSEAFYIAITNLSYNPQKELIFEQTAQMAVTPEEEDEKTNIKNPNIMYDPTSHFVYEY
ncbi:hypothetical protein LFWB_0060 [Candidatus Phytoplasma luffae]|uniref:Uncharacterized protein n=1 Tax=Loofah witches'-broom phytoplasma TaxID=35773 RepID=A0A975FIE6_LOWBP|nr:hypothetical protein LFWB_0060 [Candidatus Phytoplasma luffae]